MTIEFHLIIGCGAKVASFAIAVRSLSLLRQLCSKQLHRQAPALDRLGRAANGRRYKHNNARVVATTNCYNVFIANYTVKNNAWTRYRTRSLSEQGSARPRHTSHSVGADAKLVLASGDRQGLFVMIRRKYGNRPVPHTDATTRH